MPCVTSASSEPCKQPGEPCKQSRSDSKLAAHRNQDSGQARTSKQRLAPEPTLTPEQSRSCRVEPCTDEWVEWLGTALVGNRVDKNAAVTIEHCVVDDEGGEFRWHMRLAGGRVEVRRGPASEDDSNRLVFTSDYSTASGIALGEESIQRAFLEGRLRLKGDIRLLLENRTALDSLRILNVCQD